MSDYSTQCNAHARSLADNAADLLKKTEGMKRGPLSDLHAAKAATYATLAVYWQGEARQARQEVQA